MALDETLAAVGWLLDGQHVVTATLELRYRRPVPLSAGPLRVEAWRVGRESARRWRVEGRLLLADATVAVEGRGIFVAAPESMRMGP
jgi:acyl-CoA thioesterase FadM